MLLADAAGRAEAFFFGAETEEATLRAGLPKAAAFTAGVGFAALAGAAAFRGLAAAAFAGLAAGAGFAGDAADAGMTRFAGFAALACTAAFRGLTAAFADLAAGAAFATGPCAPEAADRAARGAFRAGARRAGSASSFSPPKCRLKSARLASTASMIRSPSSVEGTLIMLATTFVPPAISKKL